MRLPWASSRFLLTFYTCRRTLMQTLYTRWARGTDAGQLAPGHARPAHPEGALFGRAARPRRRAARRADHGRRLPGQAGLALPGAAPDGAVRLARLLLGRVGE